MQTVRIDKLLLKNYRNFTDLELEVQGDTILLTGANGTGKTNILEALSLMSPGRGLRAAKFQEICKFGSDQWSIEGVIQSKLGLGRVSSHFFKDQSKRIIEFNGEKIPNSDLCDVIDMLWITPQKEDIFLSSPSDKRKFLDRITYNFYRSHAINLNKYEYYLRERIKLLSSVGVNSSLLDGVEYNLAHLAFNIMQDRTDTLNKLEKVLRRGDSSFLELSLKLQGEYESLLQKANQASTDFLIKELNRRRKQDYFSGRNSLGPHRSELEVTHCKKGASARLCSTGEQKAMLISILVAHVILILETFGATPILLLDELFTHLDSTWRRSFIEFLKAIPMQIWISATEHDRSFDSLRNLQSIKL